MKKKTLGRRGFTMAETLLAVIILLLASTIVATGVPAARTAYEKVVLASNAEVLMSTAISTLRNELGMARVEAPANNAIVYYNEARGASAKIYLGSKNGGPQMIMLKRYYKESGSDDSAEEGLISDAASTDSMVVTFTGITKGDGYVTFQNLQVKRGSNVLAGPRNFSVRVSSES